MKSSMMVGSESTPVEVINTYEYAGDASCPSGGASCAVLRLTAASERASVTSDGRTGELTYGFAGRLYFDTEKGVIDESRLQMETDVAFQGTKMTISGTFSVKPTT